MAKLLLVSSAGGHLSELMQLQALEKKHELIICSEDKILNEKIDYYLEYSSRSEGLSYLIKFFKNSIKAYKIIKKTKPNVIISTGAHSCVPFYWLGRLFKIKTIYIESFAKVESASLTYKLIKPVTDVTIVQHEQMLNVYKDAQYLGGVY